MSIAFGLTWEYRCPFSRIASDHVITALEGGADWDVTWIPFSLTQAHVEDGDLAAWDDPSKADQLYAMEAGIVVRDRVPEKFLEVQRALFDARHVHAKDLRSAEVVHDVLAHSGIDPTAVAAEIEAGWPRAEFRKAHTEVVEAREVFGVPTLLVGERTVFVRLMDGPDGDAALAKATVERVIDLIGGWPGLNEFKHTTISR